MPDLFLQWNVVDPLSTFEIQRNNAIADVQGNRNPFIDNPYIATLIWGGVEAEDTWSVLSIQEESRLQTLSIYPTISKDYINVVSSESLNFEYSIIDYSGRVLLQNVLKHNRLDVSQLNTGFYILHLHSDQFESVFKFFKQ